jgi:hypothetical protein
MVPLSVSVLGVPGLIAVVRLLAAARRPFDFFGDEAILESAVRHVGGQLVGPYSRFGFHQPGPAYYYLQAPFSRVPGATTAALFLGAFCINLTAAIGSVAVIRRFLGEAVARWSAVVVGALLTFLTPALLTNPWNPYVLALPVLLAVVLMAAAAERGSVAAAGGAAVVASFVVQTHVAAAPTLAAVTAAAGAVGLGLHVRERRSPSGPADHGPRGSRPARAAGRPLAALGAAAAVLGLVWAPPLVDQVTHSPGNLRTLARFFRVSHPAFDRGIDHGLGTTTGQVAAELTVLPFGHDRDAEPTDATKVALAGLGVLVSATVAVAGWRRRHPFVAALGAVSVAGPAAAIWSGTRIVGEPFPYLLVWTCVLLLPGVIGAGALLLLPPVKRPARRSMAPKAAVGTALAAAGLGLSLTWTMTRNPLLPYGTVSDVGAAARLAEPWLAGHGARDVRVRIDRHEQWPLAAGVAVRLEEDGLRSTVDQEWTFLFGDHFGPTGHEGAAVWIADAGATPPGGPTLARLGTVGGASIWAAAGPPG